MSIRRSLALLAVPAAALALTATPAMASTSAHHAAPSGTEISVADTAFGPSLVVGSGPFKNFTLYYISSDHGHSFGCTTGATSTPVGPITCTGPSNDKNAEWPAITTNGRPVAGPGVHQGLLGRVFRRRVGWQVTYAGHPLYLFEQQPGAVTGEGWFEPGLPPWHGIWWLMSPGGQPVPWAGTLTTAQVGGQSVLAGPFMTGVGRRGRAADVRGGQGPGPRHRLAARRHQPPDAVPRGQARLEPALAGDRAGLLVEQVQRVPGVGDLPADALAEDTAEQALVHAGAGDRPAVGGDGGPFGVLVVGRPGAGDRADRGAGRAGRAAEAVAVVGTDVVQREILKRTGADDQRGAEGRIGHADLRAARGGVMR